MILHAGLVALRTGRAWRGVLIQGASGAGKSDLALKALDHGFRLVADDRVLAWACDGRLFGRAPDTLRDRIEIRGLGVVQVAALAFCEVRLCIAIGASERLPDPAVVDVCGVRIPQIAFDPRPASAAAKLRHAVLALT